VNAKRVAELLRELADELDEPADAERPKPPVKAKPRARPFPAPLNPVSDTDKMRAQQMLRRRGMSG
jgi:hypothetical protein